MNLKRVRYKQRDFSLDDIDELKQINWNLEKYGCGPTSIANVLVNLGFKINPIDTAKKILYDRNGNFDNTYLRNKGINSNGIIYCLERLIKENKINISYKIVKIDFSRPNDKKEKIISLMKNGNMAIIHIGPSEESPLSFSKNGHYLVISDIDENDNFYVINSNKIGDNQMGVPFDYDTIIKNMIGRKDSFNFLFIKKEKTQQMIDGQHCISVGDSASRIAQALCEKEINVDIDKAITLGYLHDIGKYNGESHGHVMRGYEYLKNKGYDDKYANICLTHSYLNNDIVCTAGGVPNPKENPFLTNFIKNHEYTIEEKLINLCDLMCPQGNKIFTIDKRLIDIMIRRGAYSNSQYHIQETYKLKEYFDNLLGYNLYDLFPKIKENL